MTRYKVRHVKPPECCGTRYHCPIADGKIVYNYGEVPADTYFSFKKNGFGPRFYVEPPHIHVNMHRWWIHRKCVTIMLCELLK